MQPPRKRHCVQKNKIKMTVAFLSEIYKPKAIDKHFKVVIENTGQPRFL